MYEYFKTEKNYTKLFNYKQQFSKNHLNNQITGILQNVLIDLLILIILKIIMQTFLWFWRTGVGRWVI